MCGRSSIECHGVLTFHVALKWNKPPQAVVIFPWHVANQILWAYEDFYRYHEISKGWYPEIAEEPCAITGQGMKCRIIPNE